MSEYYQGLVDSRGQPIVKAQLTEEQATATLSGVRQVLTSYPGDGLNPLRLAAILKEADQGDPIRMLELAETVEERDLHLVGVLGTRRRSVSQLEITVEPGDDSAEAEESAELVRKWLKRDELTDELFDMLDAIHKGYSFTEILWDTSEGQWEPKRLEWRDPRWFDFERHNLSVPQLIGEAGERTPLPGGKFIFAQMKAKSGIPLRGGLARNTAWAWMFKAFSNRDWSIFIQNYGQPIRVGKWGQGATPADKASLFRAIANIGGDMAAMIPASMEIEFVESKSVGASSDMYKVRVDFIDQQVSKAVLGQTATTDSITGGLGSGKEHRQVQEDIERADAKQIGAVINRDLIPVWMMLNGRTGAYPRLRIGRPEVKDIKTMAETARAMKLKVKAQEAYDLVGFAKPEAGDEVIDLGGPDPAALAAPRPGQPARALPAPAKQLPAPVVEPDDDEEDEALQSEDPGAAEAAAADRRQEQLAIDAATLAGPASRALLDLLGAIVADPAVRDLEDLRTRLLAVAPELDSKALARALRQAIAVAELTGREDLVDG